MTNRAHGSGLASLEWLLVMAAAGGLAAVMAVAVQRLLDDATEVSADRSVRMLEANVLAAELSSRAADASRGGGLDPDGALFAELRRRCERLAAEHPDAIGAAEWTQVAATDPAPVPTTVAAEPPATQWACQVTSRSP